MPDILIRDAVPADRATLVRFMASLQDFERTLEPNRTRGTEMADAHLAVLEEWAGETGGILVACIADNVEGFAVWGTEAEDGFHIPEVTRTYGSISDLWVEPDQRGLGIARRLVAEVELRLASRGIRQLQIRAVTGNEDALRLYRSLGYTDYEIALAKALPLPR